MRIVCPVCAKPLNIVNAAAIRAQCPGCSSVFPLAMVWQAEDPEPAPPRPAVPRPVELPHTQTTRSKGPPSPVRSANAPPRRARPPVDDEEPVRRRVRYVSDDEDDEDDDYAPRSRRRADDDEDRPRRRKVRKKRRRSQGAPFTWTRFNLGMLLGNFALAMIWLLLWLAFGSDIVEVPMFFQALAGILMYLGGIVLFIVFAFMDDIVDGILVLLVPFYAFYYLCKSPASHGPFCMWLASLVIFGTAIGERVLLDWRAGRFGGMARPAPQLQMNFERRPFEGRAFEQHREQQAPVPQAPAPQPPAPPPPAPPQPPAPKAPTPQEAEQLLAAEIDKMLAHIEVGDARSSVSARDLRLIKPIPEYQPKVIAKAAVAAKSPIASNRRDGISVLTAWASPKDIPLLIEVGNGLQGLELGLFAQKLGKFKDERTIPLIIRGVRDPDGQGFAARGLREAGPVAERFTLPLLKEKRFFTVFYAIEALSDVGTEASLPALQQIADSNSVDVRWRTVWRGNRSRTYEGASTSDGEIGHRQASARCERLGRPP